MSNGMIALLFALGSSAWVYNKLRGRTGSGNQQTALMGAGAIFVLGFIVMFTVAHSVLH